MLADVAFSVRLLGLFCTFVDSVPASSVELHIERPFVCTHVSFHFMIEDSARQAPTVNRTKSHESVRRENPRAGKRNCSHSKLLVIDVLYTKQSVLENSFAARAVSQESRRSIK